MHSTVCATSQLCLLFETSFNVHAWPFLASCQFPLSCYRREFCQLLHRCGVFRGCFQFVSQLHCDHRTLFVPTYFLLYLSHSVPHLSLLGFIYLFLFAKSSLFRFVFLRPSSDSDLSILTHIVDGTSGRFAILFLSFLAFFLNSTTADFA